MATTTVETVDLGRLAYGQRLKVLRLVAGLRQEDVAHRAGVRQVTVSSLERAATPPVREDALASARKVEAVLTGAGVAPVEAGATH